VLPVDSDGVLQPDVVEEALRDDTVLVAVMWANNETGVVHPIPGIAERVHERGIALFCDATQAVGKVPVDARHVDLLACSGHKFYGPKGTGALFVARRDRRLRIAPQIEGGGQESGLRGGTLNVPGIVGIGAAAELAGEDSGAEWTRLAALRDDIERSVARGFPDLGVNGRGAPRLPNTSSLTFHGLSAADLIAGTRDLALSTGSACSSGTGKPSHVLRAMGLPDADGAATIRLSIGRFTTADEASAAAERLAKVASSLAERTPA
jgi:cysteine desulfurase